MAPGSRSTRRGAVPAHTAACVLSIKDSTLFLLYSFYSAGKFYGQGGLRCVLKGSSPGNFMGGSSEGVAFAWDFARPPGFPRAAFAWVHGRMCCLAVVLSAVFSTRLLLLFPRERVGVAPAGRTELN